VKRKRTYFSGFFARGLSGGLSSSAAFATGFNSSRNIAAFFVILDGDGLLQFFLQLVVPGFGLFVANLVQKVCGSFPLRGFLAHFVFAVFVPEYWMSFNGRFRISTLLELALSTAFRPGRGRSSCRLWEELHELPGHVVILGIIIHQVQNAQIVLRIANDAIQVMQRVKRQIPVVILHGSCCQFRAGLEIQ
jgi:hypothetical protein